MLTKEDVAGLIELQKADLHIMALKQSKSDFPAKREELQTEIDGAKQNCDNIQTKTLQVNEERKLLERNVEDEKVLLKKSEQKLATISTNKEYDAVHTEIDGHSTKIKNAEDRELALMEENERLGKETEETETVFKETEQKNSPLIQALDNEIAQIESKVEEANHKRRAIADKIAKKATRAYDRILKGRKNGKVLGFVLPGQRSCSFCFKSLSLQQVTEVRRNNELIFCDSCGSILVWLEKEDKNGESK